MSRWSLWAWLAVMLALFGPIGGAPTGAAGARAAAGRTILVPAVPNRTDPRASVVDEQPRGLVFGVYPGGRTGESSTAPLPDPLAVLGRLAELAGGRPLLVHLYTAWSWYDPAYLEAEIGRFGGAGYGVVLTVKYAPPAGHEGDVAGYEAFVRALVRRHAPQPGVVSFVIGNEANVTGSPDAADGAFAGARAATARGVTAAREEIARLGAPARVGFNFAWTGDTTADALFVQDLARLGGPEFARAVQFVGVSIYTGTWGPGTGRPYEDMLDALASARASVDAAPELRGVPLEILEAGAPMLDEERQAAWLSGFVLAVVDTSEQLNVTHLNWFDLWDSDSRSGAFQDHYGLLRSDLTAKPAFAAYRQLIGASGTATGP